MDDLIKKVHEANKARAMEIFGRRMLKLGEEYGEAAQAYLSVSSENNSKKKTWGDVREELTDVLIVAMDLFLHQMPDEDDASIEAKVEALHAELDRKLKKWHKRQKKQEDQSK